MSLQINIPATVTVSLDDGRAIKLTEEQISCVWSFTERGGDFDIFFNLLKFLAELNPVNTEDLTVRIAVLEAALRRVRQGYRNVLEVRKLTGDSFGGRYGALTREEITGVIEEIDVALGLRPNKAIQSANAGEYQPANETGEEHQKHKELDRHRADALQFAEALRQCAHEDPSL